ncbi:hypothetical protein LV469_02860 [Peptoniphilus sp. GNH]|nr:hypothetical protein LV469_02860 [Peptoniphilus sp. GNH]
MSKGFFKEGSIIVGAWVTMILSGERTLDDVPDIWDLRAVVKKVLDQRKGDK